MSLSHWNLSKLKAHSLRRSPAASPVRTFRYVIFHSSAIKFVRKNDVYTHSPLLVHFYHVRLLRGRCITGITSILST